MEQEEIGWGKKMIKVSIHFWTNNLPKGTDNKTAWASGAIHVVANKKRGLKHNHIFFNNKEDLLPKLQKLLESNGIRLIEHAEKFNVVDLSTVEWSKKG